MVIVFSGFRDEKLKEQIEEQEGKVYNTLVKDATHVLVKKGAKPSKKLEQAKEKELEILDLLEFLEEYEFTLTKKDKKKSDEPKKKSTKKKEEVPRFTIVHDLKMIDSDDDDEDESGSSIVLGTPWEEVKKSLKDSDVVIVPKRKMRLKMDYKIDEEIMSMTLDLVSNTSQGFTVKDIVRHIMCIYAAYGDSHDAVLHSLLYNETADLYEIGCDS
jgi:hypothetical protein